VYNGELYNYRELGEELKARGHRFSTQSDTEVVLHFYEEFGPPGFARLNGIFAFAIDDPRRDELVLARDHLGVKPLYYVYTQDRLMFASEAKAILASGLHRTMVARGALANYLTFGHAVANQTIFDGIRKIPPGHVLAYRDGQIKLTAYWKLIDRARRWAQDDSAPVAEIEALICDAVRRNMVADVPVGSFLSGGLDSSLVTAMMGPSAHQLRTYSVGFANGPNELPDALRVAAALGTRHTPVVVTGQDALATLPKLARVFDEPFADPAAVPLCILATRAREDVTVVLTGEGGDELFGGYRRYVAEQLSSYYRIAPRKLRAAAAAIPLETFGPLRRAGRILHALSFDNRGARAAAWIEIFDADERSRLLGESGGKDDPYESYIDLARASDETTDDTVAMMSLELQTNLVDAYLEKVDKATMAASLEARVPLLDPRIVEFVALAPRHWKINRLRTKNVLREIAAKYVPASTISKRKEGFTPPLGRWLRSDFRERVMGLLDSAAPVNALLDRDVVAQLITGFMKGQSRGSQVWALLVLDEWQSWIAQWEPISSQTGNGPFG
jgi:asparagine synthase (glutamine-hydrolysing)